MDRLVFVVREDRRELYDALRRTFATESHVDVILDRRLGPRRASDGEHAPERRRRDRRVRRDVGRDLEERGWSVARIPE